ncbi:DUF2779 domain-containing protein [bacterium]|jgi:hypothetical protein|nr:DUF2779 domain-containing protein [bacterium]
MASPIISKSLYIKGVQCPKALWLTKHKKHLMAPFDESTKARFAEGTEIGELAQNLYPGGNAITFETPFMEKFRLTDKWVQSGVPAIYEATFKHNDFMCMVDILVKVDDGWELYEVKSSTGEKDVIVDDIAAQYYILTKCGINLKKASLVHINNQYTRNGEVDIDQLFTTVDLTEKIQSKQLEVEGRLGTFKNLIFQRDEPDQMIGPHCTAPYKCDFKDHCWQGVPDYSVFNIAGLSQDKKFELYYQGLTDIRQINSMEGYTQGQALQIQCEKAQEDHLDIPAIQAFTNSLAYPIAYLDFESFQGAIPAFDGIRPYQQIPFQYSIHLMNSPFDSPIHKEYLGKEGVDPRRKLAEGLIKDIPPKTTILVYNAQFEKRIISELAEAYPDLRDALLRRNDMVVDLMIPFKQKSVYYQSMKGSYSIKAVLPALVPEMSYDNLTINNGELATINYRKMTLLSEPEKEKVRQDLKTYCGQDTYAMIRILNKLVELSYT